MNRKGQNRLITAKYILNVLISFVIFSQLLPSVDMDYYLGIFAALFLIICIAFFDARNVEAITRFAYGGIAVSVGFALSKFVEGSRLSDIWIHRTIFRFFFCIIIVAEYLAVLFLRRKTRIECANGTREVDGRMELFTERRADLERLSQYISEVDTIGVNGSWGSGKTFLVDQYIKKNLDKYEVIIVEPLTCNLDTIDSYLFRQLENVLWRNCIYPRYSRKIQSGLSGNNWANPFRNLFLAWDTDCLTVFQGFCLDLDKLDKEVLLIYEDLDRISSENKDQISKLFDLSAKLLGHKVKLIYEFSMSKMSAMGFDSDYLEKYIPYTVNLTNIPPQKLIANAIDELQERNYGLKSEDFFFLFRPIYLDEFLAKTFGVSWTFTFAPYDITPRKIKNYVTEVNAHMLEQKYNSNESRQTMIAFFFMKCVFDDIYNELPFEGEAIDEIKFVWQPEGTSDSYRYSVIELVAEYTVNGWENDQGSKGGSQKAGSLTAKTISAMFAEDSKSDYVIMNRCKLALLMLLGYKIRFQQERLNLESKWKSVPQGQSVKQKRSDAVSGLEMREIANIEHNKKISQLILNLYRNGRSEYTDSEAVAKCFISTVLNNDKKMWPQKWKEFWNQVYHGDFLKDNKTIFLFGENAFVSLFRALQIYMSMSEMDVEQKEKIINDTLDLYWVIGTENVKEINLDKVAILYYCEIGSRKIFFKTLKYFNGLQVIGNMNQEKIYRNFLKRYTIFASREGYAKQYNYDWLDLAETSYETDSHYIDMFLEECEKSVNSLLRSEEIPMQAKEELQIVSKFFQKNRDIVKMSNKVIRKTPQIVTSMHTELYHRDEKTYRELKNLVERNTKETGEEAFKEILERHYTEERISLAEYQKLLYDFSKNSQTETGTILKK